MHRGGTKADVQGSDGICPWQRDRLSTMRNAIDWFEYDSKDARLLFNRHGIKNRVSN